MYWGYFVSKDLVYWEYFDLVIVCDILGYIFLGSVIVDKYNSVGYGENIIVVFYILYCNIFSGQSQV